MAQVINPATNQIKLNNGQTVAGKNGEWFDAQQYINGTLSNPGQINAQSNQQGAGQQVSNEVVRQTNPNNVNYIQQQNQQQPPSQPAAPTGGGGTGVPPSSGSGVPSAGGSGMVTTPTINLQGLYDTLNGKAGTSDLEQQLADKSTAFNTAQSKINDNSFLSEANRVGRLQKLQTDYNNDTKSLTDQITMKKADVQTQLDLATKQFDINSQAATQALNQFNTLLTSGALDNANGSDIASITQATGLSSNMIQSAIDATSAKNKQTQVISFDDGTNQGFAIIDPKTGDIISKQVVAGSKILGTAEDKAIGKSGGGKTLSPAAQATQNKSEALAQLPIDFKQNKMTLGTAMSFYQGFGLTKQQIYDQYKSSGQYNPSASQVKADKTKYTVK